MRGKAARGRRSRIAFPFGKVARRGSSHRTNRGSAALVSVLLLPNYQNNNLGWCEAPPAVEHPRDTEKPPGTPSGRRLRLETIQSPVERLFPPSGGVSRGSVRVGGETFLLPPYGFSFGYKRKGVSFAPLTEARRKIVGHKMRVNAVTGRGYNPSVSFADSSLLRGSRGGYRRRTTDVAKVQTAGKPAGAGCPHPSRCSAKAQHRATFPKGKAKAALESQTPQREPRRLLPQSHRFTPVKASSPKTLKYCPCGGLFIRPALLYSKEKQQ